MTERPKSEGHKDCPWEHVTEMLCGVGGAKQEFSYGNNVEKWTGVDIFGVRRGNCSYSSVMRKRDFSVLNRLMMLKSMSKQRGEIFSSKPADI